MIRGQTDMTTKHRAPLEQHWDRFRRAMVSSDLSEAEWAHHRQTFYAGAYAMFLTMADLNKSGVDDAEFDRHMAELFREAMSGMIDRFKGQMGQSLTRRH
jgi:hypothetical protein